VHDIQFDGDKIVLCTQSGLAVFKEANTNGWPSEFSASGTVNNTLRSADRRPITARPVSKKVAPSAAEIESKLRTLPVAVQQAVQQVQIGQTASAAVVATREAVTSDVGTPAVATLVSVEQLKLHWAKKRNRMYVKMSDEITDELKRMFLKGMGAENKKHRYNAERAIQELKEGLLLLRRLDQRVLCKVTNAKSLFSRMFKAQKEKGADALATVGGNGDEDVEQNEALLEDLAMFANENRPTTSAEAMDDIQTDVELDDHLTMY
jgi:hypothetical protein